MRECVCPAVCLRATRFRCLISKRKATYSSEPLTPHRRLAASSVVAFFYADAVTPAVTPAVTGRRRARAGLRPQEVPRGRSGLRRAAREGEEEIDRREEKREEINRFLTTTLRK
jgi:hypothetical protein